MPTASNVTVADFGQHISPGSVFLYEEQQIAREASLLPYAHYLRHAWRQLNLSGVLCVDGRPTVYLCEGMRFTQQQKRDKHLFVWNQGLAPLLVLLTPDRVEVHSTIKKPEEKPGGQELFEGELPSLILHLGRVSEALECARLVRSIETGQFFHDHAAFFPANETVDRCLIENLAYTARRRARAGPLAPRVCCCEWRHRTRRRSWQQRLDEWAATGGHRSARHSPRTSAHRNPGDQP